MVPVVEDFLLKIEQSSRGLTSPKLILPPLSDLRLCALFPNLTVDWRRWTSRGEVGALTEGPHVAEWIRSRKRVAGQNHRRDLKAGWGARAGPLGPPTSGHPPLKFRSTGLAISWGGEDSFYRSYIVGIRKVVGESGSAPLLRNSRLFLFLSSLLFCPVDSVAGRKLNLFAADI